MADYSWCAITFASTDPEIVEEAEQLFNPEHTTELDGKTRFEGEKAYALCDDLEAFLMEKGIAFSRYSDGKYEYDGDEAHWEPGMDNVRGFAMLNNGGRVFTESDFREATEGTDSDEVLGRIVREHFMFLSPVAEPDEEGVEA